MNLNHLTDNELIQYVIKFDTDPVRVRLATIMERMPGCILDSLEDAGMDPDTCLFENTWECGAYIAHLENEIDYLSRELNNEREERNQLETRSVVDFLADVKALVKNSEYHTALANAELSKEKERHSETKHKLKMWDVLNG